MDLVVTVAIVAVLLIAGAVVVYLSPVRHTQSTQANAPEPAAAVRVVPGSFAPAWHAASAATSVPAVGKSVVVTANGGEVVGRDRTTGNPLWHYSRDRDLCTAALAWPTSIDEVLAVYRNSRGCSEVTALDAATGQRKGARTSDADENLRLITDSGYVLAQGPGRLETWGSNLVRGIEYGRVTAPVNPGVQPNRTGCHLLSSAISGERLAVIERCTGDYGYRLTVLGALLNDDEHVSQYGSSIITDNADGPPPVLVSMSSSAIAVYDGGANSAQPTTPTMRKYNTDGALLSSSRVNGHTAPPADSVALVSDGLVTFFTGTDTVVLDGQSMQPRYQVPNTLGPGEVMAGRLLLPSPAGITSRDPATGEDAKSISLARTDYSGGTISLRVLGNSVVEQRGSMVEVFRAEN